MPASPAVTYERARRLANIALWGVSLQCRRLASSEPEDATFVLRRWTDFDFLIVCLTRLRRAATLAARVPQVRGQMVEAIAAFDAALPSLRRMRNVAEHIDDYATEQGRETPFVPRQSLEVSMMSVDGMELNWIGGHLNAAEALVASRRLFEAMKVAASAFPRAAPD